MMKMKIVTYILRNIRNKKIEFYYKDKTICK